MELVHVAAAVIVDSQGRILLAKRPEDKHQGGLWEFPGGKVESGEGVLKALGRELYEELGIAVNRARPLIRVQHQYSDKNVLLDVWQVSDFDGEAHGKEGQPIEWVNASDLNNFDFPEANWPIITAAQLPDCYLITPSPEDKAEFLARLDEALVGGIRLVQLRAKGMGDEAYKALAKEVVSYCHAHGAKLLLNGDPQWVTEMGADGVQLSSGRLRSLTERPLPDEYLVGGSCHSLEELEHARQLNVDFALLSPIKWTKSHPEMDGLGWEAMREMIDSFPFPVYALGGVSKDDLDDAYAAGAQGIAAIRSLWPGM
ncbi:Nudix family hydrolase [Pseudomonadota bacterium]